MEFIRDYSDHWTGEPKFWTRHALRRQHARMILQAGRSDWSPMRDSAPICQLANFFHGRPGLLRVVGTRLLKFLDVDARSKKVPSNHPAVVAFKRKQQKKKFRKAVFNFKSHLQMCWGCENCKADKVFFRHLVFAASYGVPVVGLAIGVLAITASRLNYSSSGISDAADSLQLCMTDLGLGYNCSNSTYQCGGMLPNNSSNNMSSTNTTFVTCPHE